MGLPIARLCLASLLTPLLSLCVPAALLAQEDAQDVPRSESAFVTQAPSAEVSTPQIGEVQDEDRQTDPSPVFFPQQITTQTLASTREPRPQQLDDAAAPDQPVAQLSNSGEGSRDLDQLSDGDSARALAQLSPAERQVLLEAVEGTDICDRTTNIPALQALCERRLETRSAEFTQSREGGSAEDSLLGGRFDADRVATLEAAISRLARNSGRIEDFSDQAIASVALSQQSGLADGAATGEADPADDLSPETQAIVNAIVQQFGGS